MKIPEHIYAPWSFHRATAAVVNQIANGCGPKYFGGKLRDLLGKTFGRSIELPCNIHDWMYFEGGWNPLNKLEADVAFLWNLCATVLQSNSWTTPLRLIVAFGYFWAVIGGGWISYYRDK